jgi:hypothetical protein
MTIVSISFMIPVVLFFPLDLLPIKHLHFSTAGYIYKKPYKYFLKDYLLYDSNMLNYFVLKYLYKTFVL